MSEQTNPPSEKQLNFALRTSAALGIPLPPEVHTDRAACSAFLDTHKDKPWPPTEKQLAFAEKIAKENNLALPDEIKASRRALSDWLNSNVPEQA